MKVLSESLSSVTKILERITGGRIMVLSSDSSFSCDPNVFYKYENESEDCFRNLKQAEVSFSRYQTRIVRYDRSTNPTTYYYNMVEPDSLRIIFEVQPFDKVWKVPARVTSALEKTGLVTVGSHYFSVSGHGHSFPGHEVVNQGKRKVTVYPASDVFLNPQVEHLAWRAVDSKEDEGFTPRSPLIPPGFYLKETSPSLLESSCFSGGPSLTISDPQKCVVCHGAKGETVFFSSAGKYNSSMMICRGCFRDTASQWATILDSYKK